VNLRVRGGLPLAGPDVNLDAGREEAAAQGHDPLYSAGRQRHRACILLMIGFGMIKPTQDSGQRQLEVIMALTCSDEMS